MLSGITFDHKWNEDEANTLSIKLKWLQFFFADHVEECQIYWNLSRNIREKVMGKNMCFASVIFAFLFIRLPFDSESFFSLWRKKNSWTIQFLCSLNEIGCTICIAHMKCEIGILFNNFFGYSECLQKNNKKSQFFLNSICLLTLVILISPISQTLSIKNPSNPIVLYCL